MDLNECIEKGLLKADKKDLNKALKSIEAAERQIELAKRSLKAGIYEDTILNAYAAMFHSARSLLYKDGFAEKSHYALYVYLKEKYASKIEHRFLNELNNLRLERHEVLYGLSRLEVDETEARDVLGIAEEFAGKIKTLLK